MSEHKKDAHSGAAHPAPADAHGHDAGGDAHGAPAGPSKLEAIKKYFRLGTYVPVGRALGPLEKFFVFVLMLTFFVGVGAFGWGVYRLLPHSAHVKVAEHDEHGASEGENSEESEHGEGAEHGEEAHAESHAEAPKEGGHGEGGGEEEELVIGVNAIPQSVRDRQDGRLEEGQDLVEPQIEAKRSLASMVKSELVVEGPPKYFEMTDLVAGARGSMAGDAVVVSDVVLVLNNYEAQVEAGVMSTEIRALISSLVADLTKDDLKTFEGKARLKTHIQREINHLLTKGQVNDVLFSKFIVR